MNYKAICLTISILAATLPSAAKAVELCGDFKQGEIIAGRVKDNAEAVIFNGKNYPVTEDGYLSLLSAVTRKQTRTYPCFIRTAANGFTGCRLKLTTGTSSASTASRNQKSPPIPHTTRKSDANKKTSAAL